jgi:hypothetical protein
MSGISPPGTKLDSAQVIRRVYDEDNNKLRVDAQVTAVIGQVDCVIDASTGDNIAIANANGNELIVNADGTINVKVAEIALDQATDSIAIGDGTNLVAVNPDGSLNITDNGGSITVDGTVAVTATNLDVRDLAFLTDKVDVSNSVVALDAGTITALSNVTVVATDLDIRNLAFATDAVNVTGSTVALDGTTLTALENITIQNGAGVAAVNIQDGGNSITIDAVDLDIRNLSHTQDSIRLGDGTNLAQVTVSGELKTSDSSALSKLTDILTQLGMTLNTSDSATHTALSNILTQLGNGELVIGTEDGTVAGVQHVLTNNIRQMILNSKNRTQSQTYSTVNNRKQLDYIEYASATFPSATLRKSFTWADFGTKDQRVLNITWTVI